MHINCINWIPEVYFKDNRSKVAIVGEIEQWRFKKECSVCNVMYGACITCDYEGCDTSFHVRCASKIGLIYDFEEMEEYAHEKEIDFLPVFCQDHRHCREAFQRLGTQGLRNEIQKETRSKRRTKRQI